MRFSLTNSMPFKSTQLSETLMIRTHSVDQHLVGISIEFLTGGWSYKVLMKLASLSRVRVRNAGMRKAGKRHCSPHRSGRFLLLPLSFSLCVCVSILAGRWLTLSSVISAFQGRCRQDWRCWFGAAVRFIFDFYSWRRREGRFLCNSGTL